MLSLFSEPSQLTAIYPYQLPVPPVSLWPVPNDWAARQQGDHAQHFAGHVADGPGGRRAAGVQPGAVCGLQRAQSAQRPAGGRRLCHQRNVLARQGAQLR